MRRGSMHALRFFSANNLLRERLESRLGPKAVIKLIAFNLTKGWILIVTSFLQPIPISNFTPEENWDGMRLTSVCPGRVFGSADHSEADRTSDRAGEAR